MTKQTKSQEKTLGEDRPVAKLYQPDSLMLGTNIFDPENLELIIYQDVKDFLTDDGMKSVIELIRQETDPEKRKKLKLELPYIVGGIFEDKRKNDALVEMHWVIFDLDHLPNADYVKEKLLSNLDFVQLAFESPNHGLKLLAPLSSPVFNTEDYKLIYDFYRQRIEEVLKHPADATNDPARACFLSFDPDFYENREAVKISPETALQLAITQDVKKAVQAHDYLEQGFSEDIPDATYQDILSATEHCSKQPLTYADWVRYGMALKSALGEDGKGLWNLFLHNPHFPHEKQITLDRCWASFSRIGKITYKTMFYLARKYGWKPPHRPVTPTGKLSDFPDLLELFGKPVNVTLEKDRLPLFLQDYLDLTDNITDGQEGAKITALLAVIAANIGNRIYMYNAGTRHFCNIWAAIIGPSGVSRKTTMVNMALKTMHPYEDNLKGLTPKERNERDILLTRFTQARLFNLLSINPNRLILQHELSAWMQEMNKTYNAGMKQDLTNMFDGRDMNIAKMEIDEHISKPAFSILGATTEDWFFRELREVADQRGGFLQRFIICMIQNIDIESLDFNIRDTSEHDAKLHNIDEILSVFRNLPDSFRLGSDEETIEYRNEYYTERMKAIALTGNDPLFSYCTRVYDNYWFRFCTLIWAVQHWKELRDAALEGTLAQYFADAKVDLSTAQQAMYLCDYYFENTKPFLASLAENSKLEGERKIIRILQKVNGNAFTHSQLLNKSKMSAKEFRFCIDSLIERQAIFAYSETGYNNRSLTEYSLNPVLIEENF